MKHGLVTVFGASGFLGRYVVRALVAQGFRVRAAVRRPHTAQALRVIGDVGQVQLVQANLRFPDSVARAVEGSDAVVNLVGVLFESGKQSFEALHVEGADVVARASAKAGIQNFAYVSSIGADVQGRSDYARTKAKGEDLVRSHMPSADILRPSIIFGTEDNFFNRFAGVVNFSPILPLIGGGDTRFQPVFVEDVAQAVALSVARGTSGRTYELGGPHQYSFKELMQFMLTSLDKKRVLVPLPWALGSALGFLGELVGILPFVTPFLTRDQVVSLREDNIVGEDVEGFEAFGIAPETMEAVVPSYLEKYRKHGQFHEKETVVVSDL